MPSRSPKLALSALLAAFVMGASFAPAHAAEKVTLGLVGGGGNAGFFIAAAEGYFAKEGLNVEVVSFDAGAKMIAPLSTGDLDVGAGSASAGLYNASARKIDLKITGGFTQTAPNNPYYALVVRKALIDSGAFKSLADLKGRKIALNSPGVVSASVLNEALKRGGLKFGDVEVTYLGFTPQIVAMQKGLIDATLTVEPFVSTITENGSGAVFMSVNDFYPAYQVGLVFFGDKFLQRRELALKFMRAYVQGTRTYNDVVKDGRFVTGAKADRIVEIMATAMKMPPARVRSMYAPMNDPNARINVDSLRKDLAFLKEQDAVKDASFNLDAMLELSVLEEAVSQLGPYQPAP